MKYGTQIDFVPIVLGNGRIHLDVRPTISEIDPSLTVQGIPGLMERDAETGVELQAGQTLAIAGLVQSRTESSNHGLPWISEVPYLGLPFRKVHEQTNEIELLILVTPELVEPMDANEVPPCGPGMQTTSPSDWELFMKGHLEVPKCCPPGDPKGPPSDGMILGPTEQVPAPRPSDASARPAQRRGQRGGSASGLLGPLQPQYSVQAELIGRRYPRGTPEWSARFHRPRRL